MELLLVLFITVAAVAVVFAVLGSRGSGTGGLGLALVIVIPLAIFVTLLPVLPFAAYFGGLWLHQEANRPYEPPPGVPSEVTLTYDLTALVQTANGYDSQTVRQSITRKAGSDHQGLSADWEFSGKRLNLSIDGRRYITPRDEADYAKAVASACFGDFPKFRDFTALYEAVRDLDRCRMISEERFVAAAAPRPRGKGLKDPRTVDGDESAFVRFLVLVPLGRPAIEIPDDIKRARGSGGAIPRFSDIKS